MKNFKGLLLGAVAASVFVAGGLVTSAVAQDIVTGHKKGTYFIHTKDKNFSMVPGFKWQFDATHVANDDTFSAAGAATTTTFDVPRVFLGLKGRAGSPNLNYGILLNLQAGGAIDMKMAYKFNPLVTITAGNFKSIGIPTGKRLSSSAGWTVDDPNGMGLMGDRSLGVSVGGKIAKVFKYEVKVSNGQGSNKKAASEGFAYDIGVNYEPFGSYGSFNQPDYGASSKMRVNVQAGYQYANNASGTGNMATFATATRDGLANADAYFVGAGVKVSGFQIGVAYERAVFQSVDTDDGIDTNEDNGIRQYSALIGASYMLVPNKIPLSVSLSIHDPDTANQVGGDNNGGSGGGLGIERQIGVGIAYLFNGHSNKLHASWDRTSTDVVTQAVNGSGTDDEDDAFKLRWQVLF